MEELKRCFTISLNETINLNFSSHSCNITGGQENRMTCTRPLTKAIPVFSINFQAAAKALKKLLKKEKKKAAAEAAAAEAPAAGRPRTRSMDLAEANSGRPRTRSMDAADDTAAASSPAKPEKKRKKKKRKAEDAEESAPKKSKTAADDNDNDVAANGTAPAAAAAVAEPTAAEAAIAAAAAPPLTAAEFCSTHKIAVKSDEPNFEVPVPMASFESTPFGGPIRGALKAAGYPAPTPTQAQ